MLSPTTKIAHGVSAGNCADKRLIVNLFWNDEINDLNSIFAICVQKCIWKQCENTMILQHCSVLETFIPNINKSIQHWNFEPSLQLGCGPRWRLSDEANFILTSQRLVIPWCRAVLTRIAGNFTQRNEKPWNLPVIQAMPLRNHKSYLYKNTSRRRQQLRRLISEYNPV